MTQGEIDAKKEQTATEQPEPAKQASTDGKDTAKKSLDIVTLFRFCDMTVG